MGTISVAKQIIVSGNHHNESARVDINPGLKCLAIHYYYSIYPLVMTDIANCKMAIEIVDSPIDSMVIFYSYVSHYQRLC